MEELTDKQKACLAEVEAFGIVKIPARFKFGAQAKYREDWDDGEKFRTLKSLVYKNLISFGVDFDERKYVFYAGAEKYEQSPTHITYL